MCPGQQIRWRQLVDAVVVAQVLGFGEELLPVATPAPAEETLVTVPDAVGGVRSDF